MSRFTYGHIPDSAERVAFDLRYRHLGLLIGAAPAVIPDQLSYDGYLPDVPNQGGTSSCVGQAFATSCFVRAQIAGAPIPRPSPKAIYDIARLLGAPRTPLADQGSIPEFAITGMQDYGLVAEDRWPLSDANVNTPPPLDVFVHGIGAILSGYYRIASSPGAATLVRQALAKGFLPCFAMPVDAAYEELEPGTVYTGAKGPILGGHMQASIGYEPGAIIVAGSWGRTFADNGFAKISDACFESIATDILVPTVVPTSVT